MKIYICDDEINILYAHKQTIEETLTELNISAEILLFESGQQLLAEFEAGKTCDVVFLDILLPVENGVEFAKKIRGHDQECDIVFVTGTLDYAINGYEVGALRYILKPLTTDAVRKVISEISEVKSKKNLLLVANSTMRNINTDSIYYIEHLNRKTFIHCKEEVIEIQMGLSQLMERLDAPFVRCHASFIVNLKHCRQITTNSIILHEGINIPISRSNVQMVKKIYFEHHEKLALILKQ